MKSQCAGSYSNCAKRGPTNSRTDSCYSTRTAFRSPWQNGVAERWMGSCRRDLLDHVIVLNERHLKRLMSSYLLYYHQAGRILD